ncbi:hypothetical protein Cp1R7AA1_174 [Mesorhizobium phage Cp1R7A-A1]|nr:hypothetical protein Cp1R7AA1_174 [Mesorhizobium phage Cp1R7A-A1]
MLNAIFHCDSIFLDQRPDGSLGYRTGSRPTRLEGGVSITPLEEKQPLFTIETESGATLTLSPESVFALRKTPDGRVVRYVPVDGAYQANPPVLDWASSVEGIDKRDLRRFALIGMLVANGTHSTDRSRPSNITLPTLDLGEDVHRFLEAIATDQNHGGFGRTRRPTVRLLPDGTVFIKSRTLSNAASWQIEPKTQELMFDPMHLGRDEAWAFAYGLLNGALRTESRYVIAHRSLGTLRLIKHMLELRFGVSADIAESLCTDEKLSIISSGNQFVITLDEPALEAARTVGLLDSQGNRQAPSAYRAEKIVKIETIPAKSSAAIITGKRDDAYPYPLTANTFVFASEFEVNGALTDLAAHPAILTDPSDPVRLIEAAPVHFARGKKVS